MFNEENLKNFKELPDDEIRSRIFGAAATGNISPERLKSLLSEPDKIRNVISKMKPSDIERFIRILGRENAEKMAEKLKENL